MLFTTALLKIKWVLNYPKASMLASTLMLDVHVTTALGVTTGTIMALIQKAEKFIQQIPRSTYSLSVFFQGTSICDDIVFRQKSYERPIQIV